MINIFIRIILFLILLFDFSFAIVLNKKQFSNFLASNNVILLTPLSVSSVSLPDDLQTINILQVLRGLGYSYKNISGKIYAYKKATVFIKYCFPVHFPFKKVCKIYYYDPFRCSLTCSPTNLDFLLTFITNNKPYDWGYGKVIVHY